MVGKLQENKKILVIIAILATALFVVRYIQPNVLKLVISQPLTSTKTPSDHEVDYVASLKQISTSGDTRFWWYDTNAKQIKDPGNQYSWFWAMPVNVPDDSTATDEWVKYIQDNEHSVFRIKGTRETDCGHNGPDHCVESIAVESIEVLPE